MTQEDVKLKLGRNSVLLDVTYWQILTSLLGLAVLLFSFALWAGPLISDRHNDERYVRSIIHDQDMVALREEVQQNRADAGEEFLGIKKKLDEMDSRREEDTKEILRYLRR